MVEIMVYKYLHK